MQIFTGADIITISRFDDKLNNQSFLNLSFTKAEQNYCLSKSNPSEHLAARFAAKEAVTKAISGIGKYLLYKDIEIKNNSDGRPFIELHTDDELLKNIKIDVSLSHAETSAIAFALVYIE